MKSLAQQNRTKYRAHKKTCLIFFWQQQLKAILLSADFDIEAKSEEQARKKIRLEYPKSKGFVIDCVDVYKFGG